MTGLIGFMTPTLKTVNGMKTGENSGYGCNLFLYRNLRCDIVDDDTAVPPRCFKGSDHASHLAVGLWGDIQLWIENIFNSPVNLLHGESTFLVYLILIPASLSTSP